MPYQVYYILDTAIPNLPVVTFLKENWAGKANILVEPWLKKKLHGLSPRANYTERLPLVGEVSYIH
jgi:hypothetical protein